MLEKQKKMRLAPASNKRWNENTLSNYLALLAQRFNLCLTDNSIPKTNACFTEETSLISRMAQLIVVAMTHFYTAEQEDVEWRKMVNQLSEEDRILYELVSYFHDGRPV